MFLHPDSRPHVVFRIGTMYDNIAEAKWNRFMAAVDGNPVK